MCPPPCAEEPGDECTAELCNWRGFFCKIPVPCEVGIDCPTDCENHACEIEPNGDVIYPDGTVWHTDGSKTMPDGTIVLPRAD